MFHQTINLLDKPTEHGFMPTVKTYVLDTVDNDKLRPAVIVFPGGGYSGCSYREGERVALAYNSAGFHSFVVDYRCSPHRHPAPLYDAAAAIKYIREHAKEWKIDPDMIVVVGFSAGGHLAASISTLWNNERFFSEEEIASEIYKPNASILCYPVITSGEKAHRGSFDNLLGKDAPQELVDFLSLENRVSENTPPTFLWHTFDDKGVPCENSLYYAEALAKYKIQCELHIYPIGAHGQSRATNETIWCVSNFRRTYGWLEQSCEWLVDLFKLTK